MDTGLNHGAVICRLIAPVRNQFQEDAVQFLFRGCRGFPVLGRADFIPEDFQTQFGHRGTIPAQEFFRGPGPAFIGQKSDPPVSVPIQIFDRGFSDVEFARINPAAMKIRIDEIDPDAGMRLDISFIKIRISIPFENNTGKMSFLQNLRNRVRNPESMKKYTENPINVNRPAA